jgi:dTDP-4-dehydrorhamnose reductase
MASDKHILIVGGDSLIGAALSSRFAMETYKVSVTSRRPNQTGKVISFDLACGEDERLLALKADIVIVCAAMTNMQSCENNPLASRQINVTSTVNLIRKLLEGETFVVFLSSNTVFDGETSWPAEDAQCAPVGEYGQQKADAEKQLRTLAGADRLLAIVRLSKVMSGHFGMAREFKNALLAGQSCRAFSDLLISPVSLPYVTNGLIQIGFEQHPGIFHLSGAAELSYAKFAALLAARLGAEASLIQLIRSTDTGVDVSFKPKHPGLGMPMTEQRLGIAPEPIAHVLDTVCKSDE